MKSLNRYNLRHNNCVIFSIFLYFKYSFLSNSFIYKFVHAIIFLYVERKGISCLIPRPKLVLEFLNRLLLILLVQSGSTFKKRKKRKKRSTFTCMKSLNRYNLRHNNCVIFSIFLYFKYSFLSNSFIYKFVHAIIFLYVERKGISCLSVELPKIYQYWSCLIIL